MFAVAKTAGGAERRDGRRVVGGGPGENHSGHRETGEGVSTKKGAAGALTGWLVLRELRVCAAMGAMGFVLRWREGGVSMYGRIVLGRDFFIGVLGGYGRFVLLQLRSMSCGAMERSFAMFERGQLYVWKLRRNNRRKKISTSGKSL